MRKLNPAVVFGAALLLAFAAQHDARAQGPISADSLYRTGVAHLEAGELQEAIATLSRVPDEFPGKRHVAARALFTSGIAHEEMGRTGDAVNLYGDLLRRYPDQRHVASKARARLIPLDHGSHAPPGLAVTAVWTGPWVDTNGRVSPDGSLLSCVDWSTGDLATRDLRRGEMRRITDKGSWTESPEFALESLFTPDGERLIYVWHNADRFFDLRSIGAEGSDEAVLYSDSETIAIQLHDVSPDGAEVLVGLTRSGLTHELALVSPADRSVRVLKTFDHRRPERARFSPAGDHVAYDFPPYGDRSERDVYRLAIDGSGESVLVGSPSDDRLLGWTSRALLFLTDRSGSPEAWGVRMNGTEPAGEPRPIKRNVGELVQPMRLTPDGTFHYGNAIGGRDVYIAHIDVETATLTREPAPITRRFEGYNTNPSWSRNGKYIAYRASSLTPRGKVLVIHEPETGQERDIYVRPELDNFSRPEWSPDGETLVFVGVDRRGGQGIFLMDVRTGKLTLLTYSGTGVTLRGPQWHPDGSLVVYGRVDHRSGIHSLISMELETRETREVAAVERPVRMTGSFSISPDGEKVAYALNEERGHSIATQPLDGGQPEGILEARAGETMAGRRSIAWTPDGSELLFVRGEAGDAEHALWAVPAGGGPARRFELSMAGLNRLSLHPDGRRLLFTGGTRELQVWKIEGILSPLVVGAESGRSPRDDR